jgi:hypothetical protein
MNRKTQISLMLIWSVLLPISVHASGDYLSSRYIGCFRDDGDPSGTGGRDLSGAMIEYDTMNPTSCITECASRGFSYAAVQYGRFCFCGNSYGRFGSSNSCNMPCDGNRGEICGGSWANSVYRVAGAPAPVPGLTPNNPSSNPGSATGLPDLIIANVSWEPHSPVVRPGTSIRFSFQIRNIGNASARGFVRVFGPGNYSGGFAGGLNAGETKIATIDYPVYSPGVTYRLSFTVDADNTILESDENNNSSGQFEIQTSH